METHLVKQVKISIHCTMVEHSGRGAERFLKGTLAACESCLALARGHLGSMGQGVDDDG